MNEDVMRSLGFDKQVDLVKAGKCPFCGKVVKMMDFRDALSAREFKVTGFCQKCQDEMREFELIDLRQE